MNLTREAVLSADKGQLNSWCAEHIMGWKLAYPESHSAKACWVDSQDTVVKVRYLYNPTRNTEQAIELLKHLRITRKWEWSIGSTSLTYHRCEVHRYKTDAVFMDESLPLAIVIASLLAIGEA